MLIYPKCWHAEARLATLLGRWGMWGCGRALTTRFMSGGCWTDFRTAEQSSFADDLAAILPLPRREGWGEGEATIAIAPMSKT